jgi:hypothetical protein
MVQDGDLLGDGVNVAARLQAAAEPGGVCISGSVYDQIRNKLSLSFRSHGERTYKNIPQPVRTFSITETEGHGVLPASRRRKPLLKWAAAAVLIILIAGGAYWAYADFRHGREAARRDPQVALNRIEARLAAEERLARQAEATRQAEIVRQQTLAEARRRELETRRTADAQRPADAAPVAEPAREETGTPPSIVTTAANTAAPALPRAAATAGAADGTYSGPLCLGDSRIDPARCFRAQATMTQGHLAGQWAGRDPGLTVFLWGDIQPAGDLSLHMQTRKTDGSTVATANMTGTYRDGRIDANGAFLNGRTVQLNMHKN